MSKPMSRGKRFRAERQFGLAVGTVLVVLGAYWTAREKFPWLAPWDLALGALLVALGAIYPRLLVLPNRAWMGVAEAISFVMTRVVLALVFFLVLTPIGLVKRLTGWDPLRRRGSPAPSYWRPYTDRQRDPRHYEKMF